MTFPIFNRFRTIEYDAIDHSTILDVQPITCSSSDKVINCRLNGKLTPLGRVLLNITDPKMECDHKDRNPFNFKRDNLRIATHSQNNMNRDVSIRNTSGYKGIYFAEHTNRWCSKIIVNKKKIFLGYHIDKIDAAKAYDLAAIKYHGEFAVLNFPIQSSHHEPEH